MKNIPLACFALALFSLLFTHCQCTPEPNCVEFPGGKKYECAAMLDFSPRSDTFRIGDTIKVTINLPAVAVDIASGDTLALGKLNLTELYSSAAGLYMDQMGKAAYYVADNFFDYDVKEGTYRIAGSGAAAIGTFKMQVMPDQSQRFSVFIIPRKTGLFSIGYFGAFTVSTGLFDDYCYSETQVYFQLPDDRDSGNYHLARPYQSLLGAYEDYRKSGTFTFQVQE